MELRDSAVLVFGGTGGLGRAISATAVSKGARVVTSSRSVGGPGGEQLHVPGDITSADDRERIVDAALEELGRLDVVIIASGVVGFGPVDMTRSDAMQSLVNVDLVGPLALCGLVAPMMTDGGTIGVITGAVADTTMLGTGVYTAAKAGLSAAVAVMARDWRRQGVRCIDIRPPHTELQNLVPVSPLMQSRKESGLPLKAASRFSPQVILPLRHDGATSGLSAR